MGAWGTRPFDNDIAADWALECARLADVSFVGNTLDQVLAAGDDYLDADDAAEGVAAAEITCRILGRASEPDGYSQPVDAWIERDKPSATPALAVKAREAITRILTKPSELLELWQASDDLAEWTAGMKALAERCRP